MNYTSLGPFLLPCPPNASERCLSLVIRLQVIRFETDCVTTTSSTISPSSPIPSSAVRISCLMERTGLMALAVRDRRGHWPTDASLSFLLALHFLAFFSVTHLYEFEYHGTYWRELQTERVDNSL